MCVLLARLRIFRATEIHNRWEMVEIVNYD